MRISDWSSDVCSSDLDRIDGRKTAIIQLRRGLDLVHHGAGDDIAATRLGVDHFVVFFLLSDEPVLILLFIVSHQRTSFIYCAYLRFRDDHVILPEGNTRLERVTEPQSPDGVGKQKRVLITGGAINLTDHVAKSEVHTSDFQSL